MAEVRWLKIVALHQRLLGSYRKAVESAPRAPAPEREARAEGEGR